MSALFDLDHALEEEGLGEGGQQVSVPLFAWTCICACSPAGQPGWACDKGMCRPQAPIRAHPRLNDSIYVEPVAACKRDCAPPATGCPDRMCLPQQAELDASDLRVPLMMEPAKRLRTDMPAAQPALPAGAPSQAPPGMPAARAPQQQQPPPEQPQGQRMPPPAAHMSWSEVLAGGAPLTWDAPAGAAALQGLASLREAREQGLQFRRGYFQPLAAPPAGGAGAGAPPGSSTEAAVPQAGEEGGAEGDDREGLGGRRGAQQGGACDAQEGGEAEGEEVLDPDELLVSVAVSGCLLAPTVCGEMAGVPLLAEVQLPASFTLADLCDAVPCPHDALLRSAGASSSGAYTFVGDTFYLDDRQGSGTQVGGEGGAAAVDLSAPIREFCSRQGLAAPPHLHRHTRGALPRRPPGAPAGPMLYTLSMSDVRLEDVCLPLGNRPLGVFCHQGCCEHALAFTDARRLVPGDPMRRSDYPRLLASERPERLRRCSVCGAWRAGKVLAGHPAAPGDPALLCERCCEVLTGGAERQQQQVQAQGRGPRQQARGGSSGTEPGGGSTEPSGWQVFTF